MNIHKAVEIRNHGSVSVTPALAFGSNTGHTRERQELRLKGSLELQWGLCVTDSTQLLLLPSKALLSFDHRFP